MRTQVLDELEKLAPVERLTVIEAALRSIRRDLEWVKPLPDSTRRKQELAAAAQALLPDYAAGGELTVFSLLDGEDFYAEG